MIKIKAYGICLYKVEDNKIKILLCKSVTSFEKWGFLKGVDEKNETLQETAQREFFEECNIKVSIKQFEEYFEQLNKEKDIGIYLYNANKIKNLDSYFNKDTLLDDNLSLENSKVKFFNIDNLPTIKKKQSKLINEIIDFLKSKNQFH